MNQPRASVVIRVRSRLNKVMRQTHLKPDKEFGHQLSYVLNERYVTTHTHTHLCPLADTYTHKTCVYFSLRHIRAHTNPKQSTKKHTHAHKATTSYLIAFSLHTLAHYSFYTHTVIYSYI